MAYPVAMPLSDRLPGVPDLTVVASSPSTNTELADRVAAGGVADGAVLATANQTAGRGRLGRSWVSPPDTTIAVSVFLATVPGRPDAEPVTRATGVPLGWVPLAAGLAMTRTVRALVPDRVVELKWPNDVLVGGRKVCGILGQVVAGHGVVIGAGLNLTMSAAELPVPTATSLTLEGADPVDLPDRALGEYLRQLTRALNSEPEELRAAVSAACGTIGAEVTVELPRGDQLEGVAEAIDDEGRLVVAADGVRHAVAAGDVTHVRRRGTEAETSMG